MIRVFAITLFFFSLTSLAQSAAICTNFNNCTSCTSVNDCGWCSYSATCINGNINGSSNGFCESWAGFWYFEPSSCPTKSPVVSFCDSKPCSYCVKSDVCGWCEQACVPGTIQGPYYGSCVRWWWNVCPSISVSSIWYLWVIFAILCVTVIFTVRHNI